MNFSKFRKLPLIYLLLLFPFFVFAQQDIIVEPSLIERKAQARDILEFSVTITNQSNSMARFYSLIKNISGPEQEEKLEKANSLMNWIEISRGRIEVAAGEKKEISFSVKIPFNALPGKYYSAILFVQGSTFSDAETNALKYQQPTLLLNIEIQENIVEKAEIKKFQTNKNIFLKPPIQFILEVKNIGNKEITPSGSIYIYDKRGKEIGEINLPKKNILAGEINNFNVSWQGEQKMGKYKAFLFLEYGEQSKGTLQDTIYFWILPMKFLIFLFGGILVLVFVLVFLIINKIKKRPEAIMPKKVLDLRK